MKMNLLMESWREYLKEQEEVAPTPAPGVAEPAATGPAAPEAGGSWPSEPPKLVRITAGAAVSQETIMETWNKLAAMNPPKNAEEILKGIGGPQALVNNVRGLEKNFEGSEDNPSRIDMPVVDPQDDMGDLKGRLDKGQLDFKPPFAGSGGDPNVHNEPTQDDFPRGLDQDKKSGEAFLQKGLKDGNPQDDSAVTLGVETISVEKSFPTQNEVYLDKSMWNIMNFGPTKIGGVAFGDPNLIAISEGEEGPHHILDGHHRWSSAFISGGPAASIRVQALKGLNIATAIPALRSYGNARGHAQKG